ncbi:hypothetical protein BKM32_08855 [Mangrovimonas sp. DI 80]|nr:hypothetical protein BKM32_08855 [Mangrovimonas sp. DI 80]
MNIGDNRKIAAEFFGYFKVFGNLQPDHKVLEVGSGFGRMAVPLTDYLNQRGSYDGLEIMNDAFNWCNSNFTPRFPNFKFHKVDVYNKRYNPTGKQKASDYEFPFKQEAFDFIWVTSVFTHMFWEEIERYLFEIYRVLKPGGTCCITWYIMDPISLSLTAKDKGTYNFKHYREGYWVESKEDLLYQIAFAKENVEKLYQRIGFKELEIKKGKWSGYSNGLSFQDVVIANR